MTFLARTVLAALGLCGVLATGSPATAASDGLPFDDGTGNAPATLVESIVIRGKYLYVGDIFHNAGEATDEVVARSPAPGKEVVLDAYWLYKVARKYGVDWRPVTRMDRALLRRDSRVVSSTAIERHIHDALADRGAIEGAVEVVLANRGFQFNVPSESPADLAVRDLVFDPRSGRFSAIVSAPANSPDAVSARVGGSVHEVTDVPVLARRLAAGEVIEAADLEWVPLRSDRLTRNIIVDADQLIGLAPRRAMHSGRAINQHDVERPELVSRGSLVIMELTGPGMRLTARGKALDDGGKGDTVRVTNLQSKTVVEGLVTGPGKVAVSPLGPVALN